ncbi:MAG: restriction endonuclease subunit S [Hylemonella sp.]
MKILDLFSIDVAKSKSTDDYPLGEVPFVTNTEINNGVVRYVEPFDDDKVFEGPAICISGLGYATVHYGQFLPKGNGGDSCTILKPKAALKKSELLYYAALFNTLHGWRFSFGRKASRRRLESLQMTPLHSSAPIQLASEIEENNRLMESLLEEKEAQLRGG